jgi:formylglycine-generating enzyme required for sulfatase activity
VSRIAWSLVILTLLASCASAPPGSARDPTATRAPEPGAGRADAKGIEQVWVPAGAFMMGSDEGALRQVQSLDPPRWVVRELPSEQPAHPVRLASGYWIDRYEVTNAAFDAFVRDGGYGDRTLWSDRGWAWLGQQPPGALPRRCFEGPTLPRVCVTWYEAEAYARWRDGRLPTEAEWEFAARGPESQVYPWGDAFDAGRCNVIGSTGPEPVGSHPAGASWIGAHDLAGNAMEWVLDWLDKDYYALGVRDDPGGPASGTIKVEKGGWWGSNPFVARAAYRHYEDPPDYNDHHIGFRIVSR